jgi:peroxiredoxin
MQASHHQLQKCAIAVAIAFLFALACAAQEKPVWNEREKPIVAEINGLRKLDDNIRSERNKALALQIRHLPASANKLRLALGLANLSTEGDFGRDTLQEVTTTLENALNEQHPAANAEGPNDAYVELASLVRYEHMTAQSSDAQFAQAMSRLESDDATRQKADFILTDLSGKKWHLQNLRGKVVLVNFWATWCPPCRKEMPDLQALYEKYKESGLVVLAISDEEAGKVEPFIAERKISYPVMLDPGRKVNDLYRVDGIPKTFVYDRNGKMVAQSIDMRTKGQFQQMLSQAGLK